MSDLRAVIEPVRLVQCSGCRGWFVAVNEHARRFCTPRCRNRTNVRAFRSRLSESSK